MIKNSISQFSERKNAKSFGLLPNGDAVICYTLTNKNGAELSVINFGATITSLKIPISNGKNRSVSLNRINIWVSLQGLFVKNFAQINLNNDIFIQTY